MMLGLESHFVLPQTLPEIGAGGHLLTEKQHKVQRCSLTYYIRKYSSAFHRLSSSVLKTVGV